MTLSGHNTLVLCCNGLPDDPSPSYALRVVREAVMGLRPLPPSLLVIYRPVLCSKAPVTLVAPATGCRGFAIYTIRRNP